MSHVNAFMRASSSVLATQHFGCAMTALPLLELLEEYIQEVGKCSYCGRNTRLHDRLIQGHHFGLCKTCNDDEESYS